MHTRFYITTTLPYVNAAPHLGFALEIIQADMLARYHSLLGKEVFFNFGTDEHGQKIYQNALDAKKDPQEYVDEYAAKFDRFKEELNVSYTNFIRTTYKPHIQAAQEFWRRCEAAGDIYKKEYSVKYCVGCELEKTDSELEDGKCPLHPNNDIESREEENYFFKFSKYQEPLLKLYKKYPDFVLPEKKFNEIKSFTARGLQDFSISRLKEKMPWGVPVPGDNKHVMYVWFDALINYISAIGWPTDEKKFRSWWLDDKGEPQAMQIAGKDNLRQQSAMWQAMLLSVGIPPSRQILIHGFLTVDGKKISKSLGNVIDPFEVAKEYGTDALRYFLLRAVPSGEDGDFSFRRLRERYSADLVNGLGNLTARVISMIEKYQRGIITSKLNHRNTTTELQQKQKFIEDTEKIKKKVDDTYSKVTKYIQGFNLDRAIDCIMLLAAYCDSYVELSKPWKLAKEGKDHELRTVLYNLAEGLRHIGILILPVMPYTGEKILAALDYEWKGKTLDEMKQWGLLEEGTKVKKPEMLFPRREHEKT